MATKNQDLLAKLERWQVGIVSDDEKIEFLQTAIADLQDSDNVALFKSSITDLAKAAVQTEEAFDRVNRSMVDFVDQHASQFPALAGFQQSWDGYKTRWTKLIWTSRDLASKTSVSYKEYDQIFLEMVDQVRTKEDMADAADALERYGQEKPIDIPSDFSQQFLTLRRDVAGFQTDFTQWCNDQGTKLDREAEQLKLDIQSLLRQVDGLNKQVSDAAIGLGVISIFGIIGIAIGGTALGILIEKRNGKCQAKERDLNSKRARLEEVNKNQQALAHIQSEFDGLNPDIELICSSLNVFAETWAGFHSEALQFSDTLKKLPDAQYPLEFRLRVKLAREIAAPLQASLEEYATTIHVTLRKKILDA